MSVAEKISEKQLKALSKRAGKIAAVVELATRTSKDANVRREGSRLGEVLAEWLDEIKELVANDDVNAPERLASFRARLRLAEAKIERWSLPPVLFDQLKNLPEKKKSRKAA